MEYEARSSNVNSFLESDGREDLRKATMRKHFTREGNAMLEGSQISSVVEDEDECILTQAKLK